MAPASSQQHAPPKSWEIFEEMAADLFQHVWRDDKAERYALTGERQNGVDIVGRPSARRRAGVQCKKKRRWPPKTITKEEVDAEVKLARKYTPKLTEYTIVTTALVGKAIQDHANAITARHKKRKLFSVQVMGWDEFIRHLTQYPELVEKHLGYVTLSRIDKQIAQLPKAIVDELQARAAPGVQSIPDRIIAEALEKDLENKHDDALRRSHFLPISRRAVLGAPLPDEFAELGSHLLDATYSGVSSALRRQVLLRASRSASLHRRLADAEQFLSAARALRGPSSDAPAQARLLVAKGDVDGAIRILKDEIDIECRSTLLSIIVIHRGIEAGLNWLREISLTPAALSATGIHALAAAYLREKDAEPLRQLLSDLSEEHFKTCPFLFLLRALASLASIMSKPDQPAVFLTPQFVVRNIQPIASDAIIAERLSVALADLASIAPVLTQLALPEVKRIADNLRIWCELLHPQLHDTALARLRNDMLEPATALTRVHFAFAFDRTFNAAAIEQHLTRRMEMGGLDEAELSAALALRLNQNDPNAIVELITKHRPGLTAFLPAALIASLETQALIKAGDTKTGRSLMEAHGSEFSPAFVKFLEAEIDKADGADPLAVQFRLFAETKATDALQSLVEMLFRRGDHRQVAIYAEELYARTEDPDDIALATQAAIEAGEVKNSIRLLDAYPFIEERDPAFVLYRARTVFHSGQLREVKELIEKAAKAVPPKRDLDLEIRLAIATGRWEALARILSAFLDEPTQYSPLMLIQAAHLSQASGQGPMRDLRQAALSRAGNDPNIWLGAYTLSLEGGDHEDSEQAHEWFRKALDLSGEDGPIKRFELKELLPQQIEWNERSKKVNEGISSGDVPLAIAAPALRTTLVDVVLRNLVRNASLEDPRRRAAIPLFSGIQKPELFGACKRLALDVTSLLVLGWLNLLPKVIARYEEIVISLDALQEIFDGQRRIRQFQRSRFLRAEQIQRAIARNRIKIIRNAPEQNDALSAEIGAEMAAFLRAAKAAGGVILRPAPLHKPGLEQIVANVDDWSDVLADTHALLEVLSGLGVVDQKLEETSKRYFDVQDKGWVKSSRPDPKKPLFIDGLALVYLQHTGLLDVVLNNFGEVFIEQSTEEEAQVLIDYQKVADDVLATINSIRISLRDAFDERKLIFGALHSDDDDDHDQVRPSTVSLLADLGRADAVAFDDRAFNREAFAQDNAGHRARCISSLNIIEDLRAKDFLTEQERRNARHRLRAAGALLLPIDTEELLSAAKRSIDRESAEFKAVRESCDLAKTAAIPRFPQDIPWFANLWMVTKAVIMEIWNTEPDAKRAAALATLILEFRPSAREWLSSWGPNPPHDWAPAIEAISLASLALPVEVKADSLQNYNPWVHRMIFDELRRNDPHAYDAVIKHLREFISRMAEQQHEDFEG